MKRTKKDKFVNIYKYIQLYCEVTVLSRFLHHVASSTCRTTALRASSQVSLVVDFRCSHSMVASTMIFTGLLSGLLVFWSSCNGGPADIEMFYLMV